MECLGNGESRFQDAKRERHHLKRIFFNLGHQVFQSKAFQPQPFSVIPIHLLNAALIGVLQEAADGSPMDSHALRRANAKPGGCGPGDLLLIIAGAFQSPRWVGVESCRFLRRAIFLGSSWSILFLW